MGRILLKEPKCLVPPFVCPVTLRDSLTGGCEAANATFQGTMPFRVPKGKFRCACGKNLLTSILCEGEEVTRENLEQHTR